MLYYKICDLIPIKLYGITKKIVYYIIYDLIPFNVIVWYNSYFHTLYHKIHNVIPLFVTVYRVSTIVETYNHHPARLLY